MGIQLLDSHIQYMGMEQGIIIGGLIQHIKIFQTCYQFIIKNQPRLMETTNKTNSKAKKTTKKTKKVTKTAQKSFGIAMDLDDEQLMNGPPPSTTIEKDEQQFMIVRSNSKLTNNKDIKTDLIVQYNKITQANDNKQQEKVEVSAEQQTNAKVMEQKQDKEMQNNGMVLANDWTNKVQQVRKKVDEIERENQPQPPERVDKVQEQQTEKQQKQNQQDALIISKREQDIDLQAQLAESKPILRSNIKDSKKKSKVVNKGSKNIPTKKTTNKQYNIFEQTIEKNEPKQQISQNVQIKSTQNKNVQDEQQINCLQQNGIQKQENIEQISNKQQQQSNRIEEQEDRALRQQAVKQYQREIIEQVKNKKQEQGCNENEDEDEKMDKEKEDKLKWLVFENRQSVKQAVQEVWNQAMDYIQQKYSNQILPLQQNKESVENEQQSVHGIDQQIHKIQKQIQQKVRVEEKAEIIKKFEQQQYKHQEQISLKPEEEQQAAGNQMPAITNMEIKPKQKAKGIARNANKKNKAKVAAKQLKVKGMEMDWEEGEIKVSNNEQQRNENKQEVYIQQDKVTNNEEPKFDEGEQNILDKEEQQQIKDKQILNKEEQPRGQEVNKIVPKQIEQSQQQAPISPENVKKEQIDLTQQLEDIKSISLKAKNESKPKKGGNKHTITDKSTSKIGKTNKVSKTTLLGVNNDLEDIMLEEIAFIPAQKIQPIKKQQSIDKNQQMQEIKPLKQIVTQIHTAQEEIKEQQQSTPPIGHEVIEKGEQKQQQYNNEKPQQIIQHIQQPKEQVKDAQTKLLQQQFGDISLNKITNQAKPKPKGKPVKAKTGGRTVKNKLMLEKNDQFDLQIEQQKVKAEVMKKQEKIEENVDIIQAKDQQDVGTQANRQQQQKLVDSTDHGVNETKIQENIQQIHQQQEIANPLQSTEPPRMQQIPKQLQKNKESDEENKVKFSISTSKTTKKKGKKHKQVPKKTLLQNQLQDMELQLAAAPPKQPQPQKIQQQIQVNVESWLPTEDKPFQQQSRMGVEQKYQQIEQQKNTPHEVQVQQQKSNKQENNGEQQNKQQDQNEQQFRDFSQQPEEQVKQAQKQEPAKNIIEETLFDEADMLSIKVSKTKKAKTKENKADKVKQHAKNEKKKDNKKLKIEKDELDILQEGISEEKRKQENASNIIVQVKEEKPKIIHRQVVQEKIGNNEIIQQSFPNKQNQNKNIKQKQIKLTQNKALNQAKTHKSLVDELVSIVNLTNRKHLNAMKQRFLMMQEDIRSSLVQRQQRELTKAVPQVPYDHILEENIELRQQFSGNNSNDI